MLDNHIGYTGWQIPKEQKLPEVKDVTPLTEPTMGLAIEGSELAWPGAQETPQLPVFDILKKQPYYIDVFNRGTGYFEFEAKANKPWIKLSQSKGKVEKDTRIIVDVDWKALPDGKTDGIVEIKKGSELVSVSVSALKAAIPKSKEPSFGNFTGEFSIPAEKFNANVPGKNAKWIVLPDLGRDKACMGIYPVTAPPATPVDAARLEYKVFLPKTGKVTVCIGILPTQDVHPERGLTVAVALDDQEPKALDARKGIVDTFSEYTPANLAKSKVLKPLTPRNRDIAFIGTGKPRRDEVFDNLRWLDVELDVKEAGFHTLKVIMADPEIVLERIVVNPDNNYPSYFGAPSIQHNAK